MSDDSGKRRGGLRVPSDSVPRGPSEASDVDGSLPKGRQRFDSRADTVVTPEADDDDETIAIDEDGFDSIPESEVEAKNSVGKNGKGGSSQDESASDQNHASKNGTSKTTDSADADDDIGNTTLALREDDLVVEEDVSDRMPTIPPEDPIPALGTSPLDVGQDMIEESLESGASRSVAPAAAGPMKGPPPAPLIKTWCDEVFQEHYLRTLPFLTPEATLREARFVTDSLKLSNQSRVLDLACGYGRHSMELAAQGVNVVAIDSSLALLERGAEEAERRKLPIEFIQGDMRELEFDEEFDGVFCLSNSFGFYDDETNKKVIRRIARALKPGGRFFLEILNRDYIVEELPTRVWWEGDGCVVLEEVEFNYFSSRLISNRSVVFDDGNQLEQEISIRSFCLHEIGKLLHAAGLRVVEVSGSMATKGRFFGVHSRDLLITAEK